MMAISFGVRLMKARSSLALTQTEFGKQVGVTQVTVSKWENNEVIPRMSSIRKIAAVCGIPVSELVKNLK